MASTPPAPSGHNRQASTDERRRAKPRRSTKGPLDLGDPPGAPPTIQISTASPTASQSTMSPSSSLPLSPEAAMANIEHPAKDFGFLLKPEIYHPLTQLETPPPFRTPAVQPSPHTPLPTLLATGHLRAAAIQAALLLTTSTSPTDSATIFPLFYTRLASLTLINATPMAAAEVKALEDLSSSFYRDPLTGAHLVPWELRVLAVRLQGVGWADWRRGVMGFYELAREARAEAVKGSAEERELWKERLRDLGVRVASALVEMGDLEGAVRHLDGLRMAFEGGGGEYEGLAEKLALLYLRIGNLEAAKGCLDGRGADDFRVGVLQALICMAGGNYSEAAKEWRALSEKEENEMVVQNLAVCLLYTGRLAEARELLECLIEKGHSFHGLTFNLSTIYELCSENSRKLKLELAERVAKQQRGEGAAFEKFNVDFKL